MFYYNVGLYPNIRIFEYLFLWVGIHYENLVFDIRFFIYIFFFNFFYYYYLFIYFFTYFLVLNVVFLLLVNVGYQ